jgi:hypothetical protein
MRALPRIVFTDLTDSDQTVFATQKYLLTRTNYAGTESATSSWALMRGVRLVVFRDASYVTIQTSELVPQLTLRMFLRVGEHAVSSADAVTAAFL